MNEDNLKVLSIIIRELQKDKYIDYNDSAQLYKQLRDTRKAIRSYVLPFLFPVHIAENISAIRHYYSNWSDILESHNTDFITNESKKLIDIIGSQFIKLTEEQKEAVVQDEINCLVLAGAGSGKTSTLIARVKYIVNKLGFVPESILLMAFTKNTAEEMKRRLAKIDLKNVKVKTFHALGMEILNKAGTSKITLAAESAPAMLESFVTKVIKSMLGEDNDYKDRMKHFLKNNPDLKVQTISFVAYKLHLYKTLDQIKTKAEQIAYIKNSEPISLLGEKLSSYEEVMLANFFYIHGIDYEYEKSYKPNVSDAEHRQYKPDFYLTEYGIYVEHFAVNEKGEVPQWFDGKGTKSATQLYNEGMRWKRSIHKKNVTKLIETYSYEVKNNTILSNLSLKLKKSGVVFKERSDSEIRKVLEEKQHVPVITKLIIQFIALYRCSMKNKDEVYASANNDEHTSRLTDFLDIFFPILSFYESHLAGMDQNDFHDLIIKPSMLNKIPAEYSKIQYVLVDEFQDMSMARYQMLMKLRSANQEIKMFGVGDDWQSIYKFSGTDISLLKNFTKFFGYKREVVLPHTFRFHEKLLQLSKGFILKNPHQIPKRFQTPKTELLDVLEIIETTKSEIIEVITKIYSEITKDKKKKTVLVLARYNYEISRSVKAIGENYRLLTITYCTVHAAKGLEADYVILLSVNKGRLGFPTGIIDDPILELVKVDKEDYPHAEERRLFYVALTRTKNKIYLLCEKKNQSIFITEMQEDLRKYELDHQKTQTDGGPK